MYVNSSCYKMGSVSGMKTNSCKQLSQVLHIHKTFGPVPTKRKQSNSNKEAKTCDDNIRYQCTAKPAVTDLFWRGQQKTREHITGIPFTWNYIFGFLANIHFLFALYLVSSGCVFNNCGKLDAEIMRLCLIDNIQNDWKLYDCM